MTVVKKMDNHKTERQELISALADGQLEGEALAQALRTACADDDARAAWQAYHLIGDVLRSAELAAGTPPGRFLDRLQQQLRAEPPLAPAIAVRPAANDASFRWKLAAGFASVAAFAAIGWNVAGVATPAQPQLAQAAIANAPLAVASSDRGAMLRDPHLDRLLAAHRQLGSATALQAPGGYLNATFEGPAR